MFLVVGVVVIMTSFLTFLSHERSGGDEAGSSSLDQLHSKSNLRKNREAHRATRMGWFEHALDRNTSILDETEAGIESRVIGLGWG